MACFVIAVLAGLPALVSSLPLWTHQQVDGQAVPARDGFIDR
jgi:hypothetical protein